MSKRNWESLLNDLAEENATIDTYIAGIKWAASRIAELESLEMTDEQRKAVKWVVERAIAWDAKPYQKDKTVRDTGKTCFGFKVVEDLNVPIGEMWVGSEQELAYRAALQEGEKG